VCSSDLENEVRLQKAAPHSVYPFYE